MGPGRLSAIEGMAGTRVRPRRTRAYATAGVLGAGVRLPRVIPQDEGSCSAGGEYLDQVAAAARRRRLRRRGHEIVDRRRRRGSRSRRSRWRPQACEPYRSQIGGVARARAGEMLTLERFLNSPVNAAYDPTPEGER
jgi:hypothetical protein